MKAEDIRTLGTEEIESRIAEESDQLKQIEFQHAIAQIENPTLIRQKRRLIARLKTILRERQNEEATTA